MLLITKERKETLQWKEPEGSFGFSGGFWPHCVASGIEPVPPSIGRGSLNHWTAGFSDGSSLITNNEKNQHHSPPEVML